MSAWIVEFVLLGALAAYLIYVNRPVFRQRARFLVDASPDLAWAIFQVSPESLFRLPGVRAVEWADAERRTVRVLYEKGNLEAWMRTVETTPGRHSISEGAYIHSKDNVALGTFRVELELIETPEGVIAEMDCVYTRGPFWRGFMMRLGLPFATILFRKAYEPQLKEYCRENRLSYSGSIKSVGGKHDLAARFGGWPFLLSAAAVLWFVFDLGLWPGLVLIATILIHEGGHLFSMRRHGLQASAVLIPFLGGMAYASKPMPSDASDAEMTLMGPVFGLALAYGFVALGLIVSDGDFWFSAAVFVVFVNGFNILPIPPLDGGRYVQLLMRRLGYEIFRWISMALVACGAALAWYLSSIILMVVFVLAGTLLAFTREQDWERPKMSVAQMGLSLVSFFALLAGHLWVIWFAGQRDVIDSLFQVLVAGPFS